MFMCYVSVSLKGSDVTPLAQTASAFGVSSNRAGFRQNVGVTLRIRQTGSQPRIQSGLKEWCSVQALTWWRDVHFPQPVIKLKLYGAAAAIGPANLSASRPGCDASVRHVLCTLQTIIWPDESSGWESSSSFLECLDFIWNALNGQTWECQGEQVLYGSLRSVRAFHCSSSPMIRFFTRRNRCTYWNSNLRQKWVDENWRAESFITHCRFLSSISSWRTLSFLYLKEREKSNVGGGRVSRVSRPLDFLSREQGSGPVGTLCRISPPAVSLNVWPFFFKPNREVLVPKPNHSPNLIIRLSTALIWVLFWKPNRMLRM